MSRDRTCPDCEHPSGLHIVPERVAERGRTCGVTDCACRTICLDDRVPLWQRP